MRLGHVGSVSGRAHDGMSQASGHVHPHVRLHAEVPVIALFDWCISSSRLPSLFFVEGGAASKVASTIVPSRISRPLPAGCPLIPSKILRVILLFSSRRRNFNSTVASDADSCVRSTPTKARIDCLSKMTSSMASSGRPKRCWAIYFPASVPDQSVYGHVHHRSDSTAAGVPPVPATVWPLQSRQETFTPRQLLLARELGVSKARLLHHECRDGIGYRAILARLGATSGD